MCEGFVVDCPNCGDRNLEMVNILSNGVVVFTCHDCDTKFIVQTIILEED